MTDAFDPRIVRVGIEINGDFNIFEGLDIRIHGEKFASPTMNQATIKISNLTREQRNYILTKATPIVTYRNETRTPINVTIDVGRQSYGTFRLFEGQVYASTVTQPPDIGVTLRSLTNSAQTGLISSVSLGETTQLQTISEQVAKLNGKTLTFKATPKNINNFSFSGAVSKLIDRLQMVGDVRVYIDNNTMVVTDKNGFRNDSGFTISQETGMVGIPQATESGVLVQTLINPAFNIGDKIAINSKINPSVNGQDLYINRMVFDVCNRDDPFWYTLFLSQIQLNQGTN